MKTFYGIDLDWRLEWQRCCRAPGGVILTGAVEVEEPDGSVFWDWRVGVDIEVFTDRCEIGVERNDRSYICKTSHTHAARTAVRKLACGMERPELLHLDWLVTALNEAITDELAEARSLRPECETEDDPPSPPPPTTDSKRLVGLLATAIHPAP